MSVVARIAEKSVWIVRLLAARHGSRVNEIVPEETNSEIATDVAQDN